MKIVIAGGSGFIGSSLVPLLLREGHELVVLTRNPGRGSLPSGVVPVHWDGMTQGAWGAHLRDAGAVINLAGESIAGGRWTGARKRSIIGSRVNATRALLEALRAAEKRPSVFVNASAVGYYGSVASGEVKEDHGPGEGFLADVCIRWEQQALAAGELGMRVVLLRTGVVLGEAGGALQRMILPFRFFVGGRIGSGEQWFPWIHADDVAGIMRFALGSTALSGPVNVTAPESVTMAAFCSALGRALSRPSWAPVPAFVLRAGLGEMAEMLLTGQNAVPAKLLALGFVFRYPALPPALASVV